MAAYQSIQPNQLGQGAVPTILGTLYVVPATLRTILKDLDIANPKGYPIQVTVWIVEAGGTAGDGTAVPLIPGVTVPPNGILQWTGSQVLLPNMTIQHVANLAGLGILASGGEAT
jgi:hypothetical protein